MTGALSMYFQIKLMAPHGGLFVLLIPGAVNQALLYLLSIAVGAMFIGGAYALLKPAQQRLEVPEGTAA